MRRALIALLVLATAVPALAATPTIPAKPKPAAPVQTAPIDSASMVLPAPIPLAVGRPIGDTQQCRASCAKQLYFCNTSGDDDGCGSRFAQCSASCTATYTPQRFGR